MTTRPGPVVRGSLDMKLDLLLDLLLLLLDLLLKTN